MNYEGAPCKKCGGTIAVYSRSGFCRTCWHGKRIPTNRDNKRSDCSECGAGVKLQHSGLCQDCHIKALIQRHRIDLCNYHTLMVDNTPILEHRYIWEQAYGKLQTGMIIHHLNGLKGDNRLENLVALPRRNQNAKSGPLVCELQRRIRDLEIKLAEA